MKRALLIAAKWLAGEPVAIESRRMLVVALVPIVASLAYAGRVAYEASRPLLEKQAVHPLPPDHDDLRFGVPLAKRRAVFLELADAEPAARAEGKKSFPGAELAWSADDHRGAYERQKVAA